MTYFSEKAFDVIKSKSLCFPSLFMCCGMFNTVACLILFYPPAPIHILIPLISSYTSVCSGIFPVWSLPLPCLSGVAFLPWSVNSLSHSALVSVKIDCFRESFCRKKSLIIPLIINTLIKILNMCQALLSASNTVFHFILTPFGLKKLD